MNEEGTLLLDDRYLPAVIISDHETLHIIIVNQSSSTGTGMKVNSMLFYRVAFDIGILARAAK